MKNLSFKAHRQSILVTSGCALLVLLSGCGHDQSLLRTTHAIPLDRGLAEVFPMSVDDILPLVEKSVAEAGWTISEKINEGQSQWRFYIELEGQLQDDWAGQIGRIVVEKAGEKESIVRIYNIGQKLGTSWSTRCNIMLNLISNTFEYKRRGA